MNMPSFKTIAIMVMINVLWANWSFAQAELKLSAGMNAPGHQSLFDATYNYSLSFSGTWRFVGRLLGNVQFGFGKITLDNPYIDRYNSRYFSIGAGIDVLKKPRKMIVFTSTQIGGFTLWPNDRSPYGKKNSSWTQQGFRIETRYFLNNWIGWHLAYSRFIANRRGDSDYQAFMEAGVCLRLMKRKETAVQPKQE
jgi:hypothetical protein